MSTNRRSTAPMAALLGDACLLYLPCATCLTRLRHAFPFCTFYAAKRACKRLAPSKREHRAQVMRSARAAFVKEARQPQPDVFQVCGA